MLPRLIKFLSTICVIISCANADDLLSKLSGGKINEETKDVKKLSQDEMKKVWSGYAAKISSLDDSSYIALAIPTTKTSPGHLVSIYTLTGVLPSAKHI